MIYNKYKDCDELPAKRFFKILKTGDFRFLVKSSKPREYTGLIETWENILFEYEKLVGDDFYSDMLHKTDIMLLSQNKIISLKAILLKMKYGYTTDDDLKFWGIKTDITGLRTMINQEITKLQIYILHNKKEEKVNFEFEKHLVVLENALQRNLNDNMSLKKWIYLFNSLKNGKKNRI